MNRLLPRLFGFGAITMAQKVLGFLIATQIVVVLGAAQFGIYAYLLNLANLAAMIVLLGFPQLLIREIAIYRELNDAALLTGIMRFFALVAAWCLNFVPKTGQFSVT